jgi:Lrp/AsnC family leucine-responsive transcriptional regulator
MTKRSVDATDERILRLLKRNARASYREIGLAVGLSANAVTQRMRRMEQAGAVRGYTTVLDPALEDGALLAVVHVHIAVTADNDILERAFGAIPAVAEVLDLAGSIDYEIRVRARSQVELYDAVQAIRLLPGVTDIETRPVLRQVMRR